MDPAGENTAWEKRVETAEWKDLQPIDSEFTSRDTPQHNNLAELFPLYVSGIARTMMSAANIPTGTRGKVAIEAIKCATQLDGLVIVKVDGESKTRDMHVYAKLPKWRGVGVRTGRDCRRAFSHSTYVLIPCHDHTSGGRSKFLSSIFFPARARTVPT